MSGTITHKWDGTVLTITSDSGTSSADLKGTKGDTGARGVRGLAGADGITSVNGKKGDITLTASDVGAEEAGTAESVRTQIEAWVEDGYLPLTGGTLTGSLTVNDDIYGKGTLVSQTNSYPGLTIQNASGANLAMLFSNGANGEYSNIGLRVYSSASTYSIFSFENDGSLNFDGRLYSGNHTIKGDSYPSLIFANAANSKSLAYIQYQTNSGDYGDLQIAVKNSSSGIAYFTFKNSGIFVTPDDIIANGGVLKSSKNSSPSIALTNASGEWLAYLAAETTDGSYGNAKLRVNKSATEGATFTFGNNGNINVPGTVNLGSALSISSGGTGATTASGALTNLGALPLTGGTLTGNLGVNGIITAKTYLAVERNSNPQLALKNANSKPLAVLYTETSDGSYGNTHLQVYKSATESTTFTFGNDGKLSCGSLALASPLTVGSGGTGATSAASARSNLGVEYAKYSTAETDTGNKWIDGKTIYRAVVYGTTSISNSLGEVGTLPSAVETPVNIRAYAKGDDRAWRVIPNAYHGNSTWDAMIYINGNTIVMSFGSSWTKTRDFVVIVEYTK